MRASIQLKPHFTLCNYTVIWLSWISHNIHNNIYRLLTWSKKPSDSVHQIAVSFNIMWLKLMNGPFRKLNEPEWACSPDRIATVRQFYEGFITSWRITDKLPRSTMTSHLSSFHSRAMFVLQSLTSDTIGNLFEIFQFYINKSHILGHNYGFWYMRLINITKY